MGDLKKQNKNTKHRNNKKHKGLNPVISKEQGEKLKKQMGLK